MGYARELLTQGASGHVRETAIMALVEAVEATEVHQLAQALRSEHGPFRLAMALRLAVAVLESVNSLCVSAASAASAASEAESD